MAWIQTIDIADADGELREVYRGMATRPIPAVYQPAHGGAAGIQRAHSLDPKLMALAFATTGTMHQGNELTWAERELVAAVASRTAQCLY